MVNAVAGAVMAVLLLAMTVPTSAPKSATDATEMQEARGIADAATAHALLRC